MPQRDEATGKQGNPMSVKLYAIGAAGFSAAMLGAMGWLIYAGRSGDVYAQCRTTVMQGGLESIGGPFELVNAQGQTVTDAQVITGPSMVYFGYTFCPDVCPLDSARNAEAATLLAERGIDLTPVFITVDPARDTPEVVANFTGFFSPDMIGLTGSEAQVRAAAQAYRAYFSVPSSDDEFYLVDHSSFSYLVLPNRGTLEIYRRDASAQQMADSVQCFVQAAERAGDV